MKPQEVIKQMEELDPEQEIIVAWWTHKFFQTIPEEKWNDHADDVAYEFDWSSTQEQLEHYFSEF